MLLDYQVNIKDATTFVGLKTYFNICREWGLSDEQAVTILGKPRSFNSQHWKTGQSIADLGEEGLTRLSYMLGIYSCLQILLPDPSAANKWMSSPNSASMFNGQSAIEKILTGDLDDLALVHQYLCALRSGNA